MSLGTEKGPNTHVSGNSGRKDCRSRYRWKRTASPTPAFPPLLGQIEWMKCKTALSQGWPAQADSPNPPSLLQHPCRKCLPWAKVFKRRGSSCSWVSGARCLLSRSFAGLVNWKACAPISVCESGMVMICLPLTASSLVSSRQRLSFIYMVPQTMGR